MAITRRVSGSRDKKSLAGDELKVSGGAALEWVQYRAERTSSDALKVRMRVYLLGQREPAEVITSINAD